MLITMCDICGTKIKDRVYLLALISPDNFMLRLYMIFSRGLKDVAQYQLCESCANKIYNKIQENRVMQIE